MTSIDVSAAALPAGNCIAVTWRLDGASSFDGFQVVRRTIAYPERPDPDPQRPSTGVVVGNRIEQLPDGSWRTIDTALHDGTTYYYGVFPYRNLGGGRVYDTGPDHLTSATATGPYEFGARMYRLLPEICRRLDVSGQLAGFLDIVGGQLDQMYSAVRGIPDLVDASTVDGRLLPLLADWIGWRLDYSVGLDKQRADLRSAIPLYSATQTAAAVQAGVRRVTGWDSATKEFIDNVATTNQPERYNIWVLAPGASPVADVGNEPVSFDEGAADRVAVDVSDTQGRAFYATNWSGWTALREKRFGTAGWQPSVTVVGRHSIEKEPATARREHTVWLFWATQRADGLWRIEFRTRVDGGDWSAITPFASGAADSVQRRSPALIVDDTGALWIFWRELADNGWTLRYNRFSDADLPPSPVGAKAFPPDGSANPRVEADLSVSVLTAPAGGSGPRIWVTWSRREPLDGNGAGTRSWRLASRFKNSVDVAKLDDWGPVVELAGQSGAHDREPFAFQPKDGGPPRAYFSSTRDGSWSIWRSTMDLASHQWAAPTAVTSPPYSDRAPAAFYGPDGAEALAFRSARPVIYPSAQYSSTVTSDVRYCGSSTLRPGNAGQLALMGGPADFASYFAFAGQPGDRTDADLIAGDTLGIYVNTGGDDKETLANRRGRLLDVIGEFLPATTRVVVMSDEERTV